ncbi:hypothetical protein B0H11DRAFT_771988 [Mycena galericulata]|nr:hypothetical protein B0H11DRAFT_771988 [Mycena galericulata]
MSTLALSLVVHYLVSLSLFAVPVAARRLTNPSLHDVPLYPFITRHSSPEDDSSLCRFYRHPELKSVDDVVDSCWKPYRFR